MQRFALTLVVAALIAACGPGVETFPGAPVVLVSVDTLRSDRLPAYGYGAVETPALDAFRADAILFEHAYSHYPLTYPSHASILTGLLPAGHGVRDNVGYRLESTTLPYLPRLLQMEGYATGGAVSAFVLHGALGLAEGFDLYEDSIESKKETPLGGLQRPGTETLERALGWLDGLGEGPFFLFFHIYEPHTPYDPPEPYASRYGDPYDGEVAFSDHILGRLFDALRSRGLYDPAVVLVLSDHGEGLGDHGEQEHGIFLYREVLQVPLLLKLPGGRHGGEAVAASAQLIDVAPTVLALLGLPVPERLPGRSLLDLLADPADRPIFAETYYPRLHMGWSELDSLIRGGYHYIAAPQPELYHLPSDPGELTDVLDRERRVFAELREAIEPFKQPLQAPAEVDPETMARLAALGYAGAPVVTDEGPLPDPKEQIGVLDDLKTATRLMAQKRWGEAIPVLEAMVADNPRLQDGWEKLALSFSKAGRRNAAVDAYQKALENSGGAPHVALSMASLFTEMGQLDEARGHARLAMATFPSLAHQRLAEIALVEGDLETAEREARAAVEAEPDRPSMHVMLAQVLSRRGDLQGAEGALEAADGLLAESRQEPPPGYHFVRGDLLARQGRQAAAREAFREEIERNPEILDTFSRLAVLQALAGRPEAAWQTLQEMVEANGESPAAYATAVETLRILGDPATAARLLRHARSLYPRDPKLIQLTAG